MMRKMANKEAKSEEQHYVYLVRCALMIPCTVGGLQILSAVLMRTMDIFQVVPSIQGVVAL